MEGMQLSRWPMIAITVLRVVDDGEPAVIGSAVDVTERRHIAPKRIGQ